VPVLGTQRCYSKQLTIFFLANPARRILVCNYHVQSTLLCKLFVPPARRLCYTIMLSKHDLLCFRSSCISLSIIYVYTQGYLIEGNALRHRSKTLTQQAVNYLYSTYEAHPFCLFQKIKVSNQFAGAARFKNLRVTCRQKPALRSC